MSLAANEVVQAVSLTADRIAMWLGPQGGAVRESVLRDHLSRELAHRTNGIVEIEKTVQIPKFRGVGPVDIVVHAPGERGIVGLIECKWSVDPSRDKIYEGAWDAIKLALATLTLHTAHGFLVTAAAADAWERTDVSDLFATGTVSARALWDRALDPPGLERTTTVGASCEAGGRGNMFSHAPEQLEIKLLTEAPISGTDWIIKASRVAIPEGAALLKFGDAPEFPARISQAWLQQHVPAMREDEYQRLLIWLGHKRWTDRELSTRVHPLRIAQPNEDTPNSPQ